MPQFGIANVLFTANVLFDSRLRIVNDQKRAANVAHFHLLLIGVIMQGDLQLIFEIFTLGFELLGLFEFKLSFVDVTLFSQMFGLFYQRVHLFFQRR